MSSQQVSSHDMLVELVTATRSATQLLSVLAARELRPLIESQLDSDKKRVAYFASDGVRSAREVARLAATDHKAIGRWWDDWEGCGLAEGGPNGRARATFSQTVVTLAEQLRESRPTTAN